jgi:hypothetical protein
MEIAAPAVLIRQHITVAGRHQCPRGRDRQFEQRWSQIVAGFTPIEARVRDDNFGSADEQGKKAEGGDPVRDADERRMPRSIRRSRDGVRNRRRSTWDASGVAHAGMVPCGRVHCSDSRTLRVLLVGGACANRRCLIGLSHRGSGASSRERRCGESAVVFVRIPYVDLEIFEEPIVIFDSSLEIGQVSTIRR